MKTKNSDEIMFEEHEKKYIDAVLNKLKSAKAKKNYQVTFEHFKLYLNRSLFDAVAQDFNGYLLFLKTEKGDSISEATLETKYSQLYRLYQFMKDNRAIDKNPLNEVKKPVVTRHVKKERTLTENEMNLLVAAANRLPLRERCIVFLILTTGMQLSEVASLSWCDFAKDSEGNIAAVIEKRKRGKYVKIPENMWALLKDYSDYLTKDEGFIIGPTSAVFLNHRGERISETYIQKTVKSTCQLAGIPVHPPKDLRHSVAKFTILAGSPQEKVGDMLALSDDYLLKRYAHVFGDIKSAATDYLYFDIKRPGKDGDAHEK